MLPLGSPRGGRKGSSAESASFLPSASASQPTRLRPSWLPRIGRLARWILVGYVVLAVLDSTSRLLGLRPPTEGRPALSVRGSSSPSPPSWSSWSRTGNVQSQEAYIDSLIGQLPLQPLPVSLSNHQSTGHVPSASDPLPWSAAFPQAVASVQLPHINHDAFFHLTASDLFAKTFGSALQPMEIVPFFARASGPDGRGFDAEDVTITTLATADRWDALVTLVERYRGKRTTPIV